jgi:hypothetical protein
MALFGLFRSKQADVLSHWYALVPGFTTSAQEFYATVEKELKERKVPSMQITRVEFAEGGLLSDKREYLRMTRERLVFDVCAAPFGTSYFFSCRFAELPPVVKWWELCAVFVGSLIVLGLFIKIFGLIFGLLVLATLCAGLIYVMRNAVAMGLQDLDGTLINVPAIGAVYMAWIRKDTYYRQDTRLMYFDTVNGVVKAQVEEVTSAKGIKLIRFNEHSPILGELYKPTTVSLPKSTEPS